ncbi:hypothetical protein O4J56_07885 [Nocardiopsis sp. RSe5-2]|uniref:LPXTG cell wall anchor domain-containing protein n=1 Tax=Nocardiopsis endophytica TaxID=3018445 RepID=A0ABT4U0S6_9ACTN|nr:hypothetical protein [Nocardiopsis endophytica]MDA2810554.1 hypothetical protein [Nocardiopsis endophytica]
MTPNPPARSRLTARTLIATGALLAAASVGTAAADAVRPDSPGTGGEHFAGARIAAVDWCGTGVVGDLNSDRSEGPATARWAPPEGTDGPEGAERSEGPGGVAGEQHFPEPPEAGISRVTAGRDALSAEASVVGVHFSPSCALVQDGASGTGGSGGQDEGAHATSGDEDLAALFGADDLVVVGTVESQAQWTRERGATARLDVQDLQVLGHEVEVGAGTYERTFTATGPDGPVEVDFTARATVTELPDGQPGATTASAGLDMEFDVTSPAEDGEEPERRTYRLELAGTSVHSERAVQDGQEPQQGQDPEPDDDLSPGVPPDPGDGPESDGGGSDGQGDKDGQGGQDGRGGGDGREGADGTGSDPGDGDRGADGGAGNTPDGSQDGSSDSGSDTGSGDGNGDGRGDTGDGSSPDTSRSPDPGSRGAPGRDDVTIDPQGSGPRGGLPVTGTAIAGMVAAGVLSLAGGSAALYLGRTRRSSQADD